MSETPIWDPEKSPQEHNRLMTRRTFEHITRIKSALEAELIELGQNTEGGHHRAQIHDSATLEGHKNTIRGRLQLIGSLTGISIIEACPLTDTVHIGNSVRLWTDADDVEENFTIVGPDDLSFKTAGLSSDTTLLSYKSPIGSVILGLKPEDFAVATINKDLVAVRILSIAEGRL